MGVLNTPADELCRLFNPLANEPGAVRSYPRNQPTTQHKAEQDRPAQDRLRRLCCAGLGDYAFRSGRHVGLTVRPAMSQRWSSAVLRRRVRFADAPTQSSKSYLQCGASDFANRDRSVSPFGGHQGKDIVAGYAALLSKFEKHRFSRQPL